MKKSLATESSTYNNENFNFTFAPPVDWVYSTPVPDTTFLGVPCITFTASNNFDSTTITFLVDKLKSADEAVLETYRPQYTGMYLMYLVNDLTYSSDTDLAPPVSILYMLDSAGASQTAGLSRYNDCLVADGYFAIRLEIYAKSSGNVAISAMILATEDDYLAGYSEYESVFRAAKFIAEGTISSLPRATASLRSNSKIDVNVSKSLAVSSNPSELIRILDPRGRLVNSGIGSARLQSANGTFFVTGNKGATLLKGTKVK
jgi:hypothetical protein